MGTTLEAPTHTVADGIPLGRRIEELKKEKGSRYSTAAMSKRIGLSEETFRQMLKLKRVIYTFELDKIAKDLKESVERILQVDVREETEQLAIQLKTLTAPAESLRIAKKLADQALGLTEKCHALHRLGMGYLLTYRFQESTDTLTESRQLAEQIQKLYGDKDPLYNVMHHLMESYTAKQNYESAFNLLEEIIPIFEATPSRHSAICYHKAKVEESRGNIGIAKRFAQDSLRYAKESGNPILVAKTQLNLAHFHYLTSDYHASYDLLLLAIKGLDGDSRTKLIARKEVVKTLLKLQMKDFAYHQIEIALVEANELGWTDMIGKLKILLTLATNHPSHAKAILADKANSLKIQYLACICLQDHYKALSDAGKYLLYTKIAGEICVGFADVLDEGELL